MCVFFRSMCVILIERWFWEIIVLIGSLVELHVGLHSCLCFSSLEKLVLKSGSTPPRHLAICWASQAFSYRNPDSSSIPGGSIENAPTSSIASQHLVDRSSFYSWIWFLVAQYLLDTSAVDKHFLDTYLNSFLDTSSVELYWRFYLNLLVQSDPHFTRYLSRLLFIFSPKLSHLTPISILKGFFKLFQDFLLLVSF